MYTCACVPCRVWEVPHCMLYMHWTVVYLYVCYVYTIREEIYNPHVCRVSMFYTCREHTPLAPEPHPKGGCIIVFCTCTLQLYQLMGERIYNNTCSSLWYLRVIEEGVPTFLHLLQSEPTGELHSQVNCWEVVGLLDSTDQHQVIRWLPSTQVLGCGWRLGMYM